MKWILQKRAKGAKEGGWIWRLGGGKVGLVESDVGAKLAVMLTRAFPVLSPLAAYVAVVGLFAAMGRAEEKVDFEKQILPLLDTACFKCHSAQAKKAKGDVRLDDLAAIRAKSRSDNLLFPHKPEKSRLFKVINLPEGDDDVMPPTDQKKRLTAEQIALIKTWIEQGTNFGTWKSVTPHERPVAVESEAVNPADVAATAQRIDALVEAGLAAKKKASNPLVAEDLWCRRVYLDLIGRIPTYDEMQSFLTSREAQKRAKLIDTLLASNGHISTMYNYWCDALRARDRLAENVRGDFYLNYLKTSLRANKPYDRWVREMIVSEGEVTKAPEVGYFLRDLGNRFASVDATAAIFLGTQIGCAQCHDHPYDQWTRREYHQFVAWFTALDTQRGQRMERVSEGSIASVRETLEGESEKRTTSQRKQVERRVALEVFERMQREMMRRQPDSFSLRSGPRTNGHLPADYQYPDGKPNEVAIPRVLFGEASMSANERPAETLAAWMTSPENPRFALTIANRLWARIMGAPFAGAVESVRDVEDTANPALSAYLAKVMVAAKFDLRQFQRIVANTRTYARQSGVAALAVDYDFAGPVMRRMSAEQAWDSLMAMAVPDLDTKMDFTAPDTSGENKYAELNDSTSILDEVRETAKEKAKDELKEMRHPKREERPEKKPYEPSPEFGLMTRASELPQPAPEGHFLRTFGQSNREIADGGWRSGTVPQTLVMLNSTLFDAVVQKGTPLAEAIKRNSGDSARLRAAYLAVLGRVPTMEDTRLISSTLGGTGNIQAITHTLLGTRQFLFIQ